MKKKVLFIMGTAHCGSTLLTLILGSHPQSFAVGELSNLPGFFKSGRPVCSICKETCEFWNHQVTPDELQLLIQGLSNQRINPYIPLKVDRYIRFVGGCDRIFRPYSIIFSKLDKTLLIDSTKTVEWISSELELMEFKTGEIEGYLLHLVRDGRAVMSSYLRRNSTMTVAEFSNLWLTRIKRERALYERFPTARKLRTRYEEIVTKPQETLQFLCQWLGLDYSPEMLNYWQYDHHMVSGNTGTRSLIWKYRGDDWQSGQVKKRYYSEEAGFKISLDQRWQQELSSIQIEEFRRLTDPYYQDFEWNAA